MSQYSGCLKYRFHLFDMENNMRKYTPRVLFIFSWPVLSAVFMDGLFVYWMVIPSR
ncbi:TPA: nuclease [Escherichia coli]|nr:nuclease [Escherichia coli]HAJ0427518.1 nuclease [Escherichia coli]